MIVGVSQIFLLLFKRISIWDVSKIRRISLTVIKKEEKEGILDTVMKHERL